MPHAQTMTDELRHCVQNCLDCYSICMETVQHCLKLGGKHAEQKHIGLMQVCAKICETSAAFMLSGSEFHDKTCGVCAEVCAACAASCSEMAGSDETMQRCAKICRECAESCRKMATA